MTSIQSSRLLLSPFFWVAFGAVAILGLFIYGQTLNKDISDLAKARKTVKELKEARDAGISVLSECKERVEEGNARIATLGQQIELLSTQSSERMARLIKEIELLKDQNSALEEAKIKLEKDRKPVSPATALAIAESKRQQAASERLGRELAKRNIELARAKSRIIELTEAVKDLKRSREPPMLPRREAPRWSEPAEEPEPAQQLESRRRSTRTDWPEFRHPFGKGRGRIVVYSACSQGNGTRVWIDGEYLGTVGYSADPSCYGFGGLPLVVNAGTHELRTRDRQGRSAVSSVLVSEDRCVVARLSC